MHPRKVIAVTIAIVVLAAALVTVAVLQFRGNEGDGAKPSPSPAASPSASSPVATDPAPKPATTVPTPSDGATEPTQDDTATENGPAPTGGTATVVVTYAGWAPDGSGIEVGAYAAAVEPSGTCTLTVTSSSGIRTQTIDALVDVSTMSCGGFLIPADQLSSGTWTASVAYSSATSTGQSKPTEVVVP